MQIFLEIILSVTSKKLLKKFLGVFYPISTFLKWVSRWIVAIF